MYYLVFSNTKQLRTLTEKSKENFNRLSNIKKIPVTPKSKSHHKMTINNPKVNEILMEILTEPQSVMQSWMD